MAKAFGVHVSALLTPITKPRRPWTDEEPLELAASALILLRQAKGWTQEELATHAGVARDIVAKIERGSRNPTLEVLDRLAAALEVRTADLFASP
ncbi:helix-turn-helix domain-containing protein [Ramlibacter sp. XY19]|nr:helix-turn-helix domain-containing protein [Ramlibacter paludis]